MERNSEKGKNIFIFPHNSDFYTCVLSKSWDEMIGIAESSKAFMSQSVTKPRILFTSHLCERTEKPNPSKTTMYRWFHSVLQEKPQELVSQNQIFLPRLVCDSCESVSQMVLGLVCCHLEGNSVICIPGAGMFRALPKVDLSKQDEASFFLGYDHESQIFKVLCVVTGPSRMEYQVISLLHQNKKWRKVNCEISHNPTTRGLWLDGKVYYGACSKTNEDHFFLMCFNLKNEVFSIINVPEEAQSQVKYQYNTLAKINNKLAIVKNYPPQVNIWIREETTWSKLPFHLPSSFSQVAGSLYYDCIGTIGTGQFIFAPQVVSNGKLHIIYYDFGEQRLEKIIIEGIFPKYDAHLNAFLDYIETPTLSAIETISNMTPMSSNSQN